MQTTDLHIQPEALLATAPADLPVAHLNAALAPHRLMLPIDPLLPARTLGALVQANAGGRRRLRYGPIGRYVRAATLTSAHAHTPLRVGGPTLKRATGYALNRALAGGALDLGMLHEVTVSLRPLPTARAWLAIDDLALDTAVTLAQTLLAHGLAISALPVDLRTPGATRMLIELEGLPAVLDQQCVQIQQRATQVGGQSQAVTSTAWAHWEALATAHVSDGITVDLTVPRAQYAALAELIVRICTRYDLAHQLWGDLGVGALHLHLATPTRAKQHAAQQVQALITQFAQQHAAALSTEFAGSQRAHVPVVATVSPLSAPPTTVLTALRAIVGDPYLITRPEEMGTYHLDASIAQPMGQPLAVVLPADTAQVAAVVRVAAQHGVPLVSRGAGSGLAGGSTPSAGALVLALNRLEQIQIDPAQMVAHVGAGAITAEIQRAAEAHGLFYPPDPSSQSASTIGGNIACNAGGPRCVKYGVTADYVLALTAVLADGTVVRWGDGLAGQAPTSGLAQLLVGSEGTLAVITEATVRLLPQPAARRTIMAIFPTLDAACTTVEQIMAAGIVPAGLELMEDATIAAVEAFLQIGLPADAGAMLLMLSDGAPEDVAAESAALAALAHAGGATRVQVAQSAADEANLWRARRAVSIALTRVRPNRLGEDISVPLPQIAACVRAIKQVAHAHNLPIVVYGHAGDGNLHPNILFDANDPTETVRLWPCAEAVFRAALAVGGTLSGEHGVGTLKRPFMREALGDATLAAMQALKDQLDPANLLNPGKVLPAKRPNSTAPTP
jgi:glycolate oxidase subunit GlcD